MNNKVLLLLVGVLVGAGIGWLTRPPAIEFDVGPLNVVIDDPAGNGELTSDQLRHIGLIAAIGALAGLGLGVLVDGRRNV